MLEFDVAIDQETGEDVVEVPLTGHPLLDCPVFNKGSAFPADEREALGLLGLLPPHVGAIDEQLARRYGDFSRKTSALEKHLYLRDLQDRNEVLFYRMLQANMNEMIPLIYTPVVGEACQHFSRVYRKPRGLFVSYENRANIDAVLENRLFRDVDVIVVTDGERILGLGDLGVGGMGIPVGKLALYTLCGGIHPARTLPIILDVGTDNAELRSDPVYLGSRHERIRGQAYDDFVESFIQAVLRTLPDVLVQWEDFALANAHRLLDDYRDKLRTFNDDIQGTAAVTLAAVLAAGDVARIPLTEQRVVILGAGSAGTGIADQIVAAMVADGLEESQARSRLWLVDREGLLHSGMTDLRSFQQRYAKPIESLDSWRGEPSRFSLLSVVTHARPTTLIGVSGQPGGFTREVVTAMARQVERPTILPLSNPTSQCEAVPQDLLAWTDGKALIATGSPFSDVSFGGKLHRIGQCNNSFIFPGVGQGVISSGARRVSDGMFLAAARTLAECAPSRHMADASLVPALEEIGQVSRKIALAVGLQAQREGIAPPMSEDALMAIIERRWWHPQYQPMRLRQGAR